MQASARRARGDLQTLAGAGPAAPSREAGSHGSVCHAAHGATPPLRVRAPGPAVRHPGAGAHFEQMIRPYRNARLARCRRPFRHAGPWEPASLLWMCPRTGTSSPRRATTAPSGCGHASWSSPASPPALAARSPRRGRDLHCAPRVVHCSAGVPRGHEEAPVHAGSRIRRLDADHGSSLPPARHGLPRREARAPGCWRGWVRAEVARVHGAEAVRHPREGQRGLLLRLQ